MRTIFKSNYFVTYFFVTILGIVFALSIILMPKTFADDSSEETDYSEISSEHYVTIFDEDNKKTVYTDAKTVQEVLARLNISISETDKVSPSVDTAIDANNFFINIYRSRPVLIIDGLSQKVVNVSSFDPLTAARSAGFIIYDKDRVELISVNNFLESGITNAYKITRGEGELITIEEDIPFETRTEKSYDIPEGTEQVQQFGELGKVKKVFQVKTINGEQVEKELISEDVVRNPVTKIIAIGSPKISQNPLTPSMGRNRYTSTNLAGQTVERQETFYDLPMRGVMSYCGKSSYTVREDGVKVDDEGYIIIAAELSRYPRCSVVETSLGKGKVYDTGGFAATNPEQFDIATDWTNRDGI